jgi:CheY-like chemotaxis protein
MPRFASLPVLLITSEANHELADSFRGSSHCSVLKKPILPQALTEAVNRLVGEPASR